MTSTTISNLLVQTLASSTAIATDILKAVFNAILLSLLPYWPYFLGGFFVLLMVATIKLASGQWGAMGSLIYHVIYFGILGVIIAVKGVEILFDPIFDLIYILLYRVAYWLTGLILKQLRGRLR